MGRTDINFALLILLASLMPGLLVAQEIADKKGVDTEMQHSDAVYESLSLLTNTTSGRMLLQAKYGGDWSCEPTYQVSM
jgi:hypothetical protein